MGDTPAVLEPNLEKIESVLTRVSAFDRTTESIELSDLVARERAILYALLGRARIDPTEFDSLELKRRDKLSRGVVEDALVARLAAPRLSGSGKGGLGGQMRKLEKQDLGAAGLQVNAFDGALLDQQNELLDRLAADESERKKMVALAAAQETGGDLSDTEIALLHAGVAKDQDVLERMVLTERKKQSDEMKLRVMRRADKKRAKLTALNLGDGNIEKNMIEEQERQQKQLQDHQDKEMQKLEQTAENEERKEIDEMESDFVKMLADQVSDAEAQGAKTADIDLLKKTLTTSHTRRKNALQDRTRARLAKRKEKLDAAQKKEMSEMEKVHLQQAEELQNRLDSARLDESSGTGGADGEVGLGLPYLHPIVRGEERSDGRVRLLLSSIPCGKRLFLFYPVLLFLCDAMRCDASPHQTQNQNQT